MILPSAICDFICELPLSLQEEALKVIKEEHDRWERGDLTDEEKEESKLFQQLGENMAETMEKIALKVSVG